MLFVPRQIVSLSSKTTNLDTPLTPSLLFLMNPYSTFLSMAIGRMTESWAKCFTKCKKCRKDSSEQKISKYTALVTFMVLSIFQMKLRMKRSSTASASMSFFNCLKSNKFRLFTLTRLLFLLNNAILRPSSNSKTTFNTILLLRRIKYLPRLIWEAKCVWASARKKAKKELSLIGGNSEVGQSARSTALCWNIAVISAARSRRYLMSEFLSRAWYNTMKSTLKSDKEMN